MLSLTDDMDMMIDWFSILELRIGLMNDWYLCHFCLGLEWSFGVLPTVHGCELKNWPWKMRSSEENFNGAFSSHVVPKPYTIIYIYICSMYGIFTYIWVIFGVNVGKYSIHGASGIYVYSCFCIIILYISWFPIFHGTCHVFESCQGSCSCGPFHNCN